MISEDTKFNCSCAFCFLFWVDLLGAANYHLWNSQLLIDSFCSPYLDGGYPCPGSGSCLRVPGATKCHPFNPYWLQVSNKQHETIDRPPLNCFGLGGICTKPCEKRNWKWSHVVPRNAEAILLPQIPSKFAVSKLNLDCIGSQFSHLKSGDFDLNLSSNFSRCLSTSPNSVHYLMIPISSSLIQFYSRTV